MKPLIKTKKTIFNRFKANIEWPLFIVAIILLSTGISCMIHHLSPDTLVSVREMGKGIMTNFICHVFIVSGALVLTIAVWNNNKHS